jgi:hypothetical protein
VTKQPAPNFSKIIGIAIQVAWPCRCGCGTVVLRHHSIRSKKLILKCLWCGKRQGNPNDTEIDKVVKFVNIHGFTLRPLVLADDGGTYVF